MYKAIIKLDRTKEEFLQKLRRLREQKGKEEELLRTINKAILSGQEYIIDLFWEETLVYQHLYMSEAGKQKPDKNNLKSALSGMRSSVEEAEFYIKKYDLSIWKSRLYRFKGRISDYISEFDNSIKYYKLAIKHVKDDEDYKKGLPRQLELEAFLSYSYMMAGNIKKGLEMSEKTYSKFFDSDEGKKLKEKNYTTWAIWVTGIPIRTISAKFEKKLKLTKADKNWLDEAVKILNPPKNIQVWADFKLRNEEVKRLLKLF